jgi:hypothetical protein
MNFFILGFSVVPKIFLETLTLFFFSKYLFYVKFEVKCTKNRNNYLNN